MATSPWFFTGKSSSVVRDYNHQRTVHFSAPEPESDALRQLVVGLSSQNVQHLPRDKRRWLELLVDSPYLAGPLGVYADEFAAVGWQLLQPRNQGVITNAQAVNSLPSGRARSDLTEDLVASGDLIPVPVDHPLSQILTVNIRRWTGRRLRRMTMLHYASTGESFWHLGSSTNTGAPDEALTLTPTEVIQTPWPGRNENYRIEGFVGEVDPDEIFEWSNADPRSIYRRGRGLIAALGDQIEGAEWTDRLTGTNARNNNIPPHLYVYRGEASVEKTERRLDRKHRGLRRFFRMMIERIDPDAAGPVRDHYALEKLADPFDPTKVIEYSKWAWEFVRLFLRVPPSMLADYNDNSGLGQSGVELERIRFLESVMTPLVLDFEDMLQDLARRLYDPLLVVRHLPFIQGDREFRLRVAVAFPDRFMNDQIQALGGYPPLEDEAAGSAYLVRKGHIPVPSLAPGQEILEEAAKGGSSSTESTSNALSVPGNGHSNGHLDRRQLKKVNALPGQMSDLETRLAQVSARLDQQRLAR